MVKSEDRMIGYCGYNCHLCAARSDDINVRRKLVDAWRKYLGHQHYTAENVACEGCKSEGDKIADKQCEARPCAREKGLESCAQCDEFPCKKMSKLMGDYHRAANISSSQVERHYRRRIQPLCSTMEQHA